MSVAIVLLNRDLRVHDHPALVAAVERAEHVVPLFVFDDGILGRRYACPNRVAFLRESLADLAASLERLGAGLVLRRGDPVDEAVRVARNVGAGHLFASADVSGYARERERRLALACEKARIAFELFPGVTVVPPGDVTPLGSDHFRVFTPYWRQWRAAPWRSPLEPPVRLALPPGVEHGRLPRLPELVEGQPSSRLPAGGETAARERVRAWARSSLAGYGEHHDDLPGDRTSRLSAYLHLGCLSPLELATRLQGREGAEPFVRQVCWRDFYHQLLAASPRIVREDYRSMGDRWRTDGDVLERWKQGLTGYPVVDAGMRQLACEGWMHNRARLLVASFLVKDLGIDWRLGAAHFLDLLVDGDVASNTGNWQWVAGTGTDTRPNRVFNPITQALRFDPDGDYVRRYVPELAQVGGRAVHEPWKLGPLERASLDYPEPIVDHAEAAAAFLERRKSQRND